MLAPPLPTDEDERLAALQALCVLDTPPEERFDRITRLAAWAYDVPIALISLVDAQRQWFKSRVGLEATGTGRDISFCGHAILHDDGLVVEDARQDERFADNPLVTGHPHIRFYAGAPLRGPAGQRLGTLCLIDREARRLSDTERERLEAFAAIASDELCSVHVHELNSRLVDVQEELVEARDEAREASAAKTRFLAHMSHELRTPLNSVIGFANVLLKDPAHHLKSQEQLYLERIRANGIQLLELVDEILDLSRIEQGPLELQPEAVDVEELAWDLLRQLEPLAREKPLELNVVADPGLAPLRTDRQRLRQVLTNLVANAIKFTPQGSIVVRLQGTAGHPPGWLEVTDTGPGIAPADLARIFEAFEQVGPAKGHHQGGTGLGLAIARGLCQRLGFRLGVESAEGEGSTFRVDFGGGAQAVAGGEA